MVRRQFFLHFGDSFSRAPSFHIDFFPGLFKLNLLDFKPLPQVIDHLVDLEASCVDSLVHHGNQLLVRAVLVLIHLLSHLLDNLRKVVLWKRTHEALPDGERQRLDHSHSLKDFFQGHLKELED